jgi:3-oxoacyl-[acyl-carrier protein] reductase
VNDYQMERCVLITGCSRGIGRSLSEHFLGAGWRVIGCSRSDVAIESDRFDHFRLDLHDAAAVKEMMREIRRRCGTLDVLVNNAGAAAMGPFALQPPEVARRLMDLNFQSAIEVTHAAIRLLRSAEHPRIVNFSSVAVPFRLEGEAIYSASKAAIEQWTRVLARELGPLRITVNAVGPTPIRTDLIRGVAEEKLQALIDRQAIPRWGTIDDVINLVDFFVRPQSDFITGQVVYLGGAG